MSIEELIALLDESPGRTGRRKPAKAHHGSIAVVQLSSELKKLGDELDACLEQANALQRAKLEAALAAFEQELGLPSGVLAKIAAEWQRCVLLRSRNRTKHLMKVLSLVAFATGLCLSDLINQIRHITGLPSLEE